MRRFKIVTRSFRSCLFSNDVFRQCLNSRVTVTVVQSGNEVRKKSAIAQETGTGPRTRFEIVSELKAETQVEIAHM